MVDVRVLTPKDLWGPGVRYGVVVSQIVVPLLPGHNSLLSLGFPSFDTDTKLCGAHLKGFVFKISCPEAGKREGKVVGGRPGVVEGCVWFWFANVRGDGVE